MTPARPVTSLREGTRAQRLRAARTCYDHLAGMLGVAVTQALSDHGALIATDGQTPTARRARDRLSAPVREHPYAMEHAAGNRGDPELLRVLFERSDRTDKDRRRMLTTAPITAPDATSAYVLCWGSTQNAPRHRLDA